MKEVTLIDAPDDAPASNNSALYIALAALLVAIGFAIYRNIKNKTEQAAQTESGNDENIIEL